MRKLSSLVLWCALLAVCVQAQGPVLAWTHLGPVDRFQVRIDAQPPINVGVPPRDTMGRYVWDLPATLSAAAHSFIIEACNALNVCAPSVTLKVQARTSKPNAPTAPKFEQTVTGRLGTGLPVGTTAGGQGPPGGGSRPDAPTTPSPVNGATDVSLAPRLTFTAANATSYAVYFGATPTPTEKYLLGTTASFDPFIGIVVGAVPSTQYCWIAEATNANGSTQGNTWCFTTVGAALAPSDLAPIFPASGATGVSINPTLSCSATGATSYEIRFGTSNPPGGSYTSLGTSCSYAPAPLTNSTAYYWQIRATNVTGSTESSVFSFTTVSSGSLSFVDRPRLILTSAKLAELVSRKNSNTAEYLQLKNFVDLYKPTDNSNTTLTSAITLSQGVGTTFTVADGSAFPTASTMIRVNTEAMVVTRSGNTFTIVSRNQDATGAGGGEQTAHAIGATLWKHTTINDYFQIAVGASLLHQLGVAGYEDVSRNALNLVMHIFAGFPFYQSLNRPHWSGSELAMAYDWTYDLLTADDKQAYATLTHTLITYYTGSMDSFYFTPSLTDHRSFWEQHATMNITAGVIRFVEQMSAVADGDDADALDHWNRAVNDWIPYVRSALLSGATSGGINAEGSEYSTTDWIIYQDIFASLASATDSPGELQAITPYLARFVKLFAYMLTPGASKSLVTTTCSGSVGATTLTCGDLSSFAVGENVTQTLDLGAGTFVIDGANRARVTPSGWTVGAGDVGKAIWIQFYDQHWRFWVASVDGPVWVLEHAIPTTFGDVDFAYDVPASLPWSFGGDSGYSPGGGALWKTAVMGKSGPTLTIRDPLPDTVTNQALAHQSTYVPFGDTEATQDYNDFWPTNGEPPIGLAMAQDTLIDNGDTTTAQYAEYILDNQLRDTINYLYPMWFIWHEPSITPVNPNALPLARSTEDLDSFALLFSQSDWTPTRTQMYFIGGGDSGNHVMSNYGSFSLRRKGVYLTRNQAAYGVAFTANTLNRCEFGCGLRLSEVPFVGSRWHNSVQMNGHSGLSNLIENTRYTGPSGFTAISTGDPTHFAYARMDASNVYSGAADKFNWSGVTGGLLSNNARKWWRDVMYINPDVLFVRDRNTYAAAATSQTRWHFQFRCDDPVVSGQRVTCTYAGQTIVQDILRPSSATLTEFNYRTLDGWLDGSRIQVESGVSASEEYQVSVIQLGDSGFTPVTPVVLTTTNADVVEIPVNPSCPNACVVGAARGDGLTFPIAYTYSATDPDHRITGFSPSTVYKVDNNAGTKTVTITSAGAGSNVTADAGGVLVF